jgi:hypothetical protein
MTNLAVVDEGSKRWLVHEARPVAAIVECEPGVWHLRYRPPLPTGLYNVIEADTLIEATWSAVEITTARLEATA